MALLRGGLYAPPNCVAVLSAHDSRSAGILAVLMQDHGDGRSGGTDLERQLRVHDLVEEVSPDANTSNAGWPVSWPKMHILPRNGDDESRHELILADVALQHRRIDRNDGRATGSPRSIPFWWRITATALF